MKQKRQRCVRRVKKTQEHEVPEPRCKEKGPQLVVAGDSVKPGKDHRIQQRRAANIKTGSFNAAVQGESQIGMSSERKGREKLKVLHRRTQLL